jgi:hypothetical protein
MQARPSPTRGSGGGAGCTAPKPGVNGADGTSDVVKQLRHPGGVLEVNRSDRFLVIPQGGPFTWCFYRDRHISRVPELFCRPFLEERLSVLVLYQVHDLFTHEDWKVPLVLEPPIVPDRLTDVGCREP